MASAGGVASVWVLESGSVGWDTGAIGSAGVFIRGRIGPLSSGLVGGVEVAPALGGNGGRSFTSFFSTMPYP